MVRAVLTRSTFIQQSARTWLRRCCGLIGAAAACGAGVLAAAGAADALAPLEGGGSAKKESSVEAQPATARLNSSRVQRIDITVAVREAGSSGVPAGMDGRVAGQFYAGAAARRALGRFH
jgi:hypothetical protein